MRLELKRAATRASRRVDAIGEVRVTRLSGSAIERDRGTARRLMAWMVSRPRVRPTLRAPSADPVFAFFVALVADAPVAAFIKDPDGRYLYANPHMLATIFEPIAADWSGKSDADIWPANLAATIHATDEASGLEGTLQLFTQVMPIAGEPHTFLVMKHPLRLGDGRICLGGFAIDQTEHLSLASEREWLAMVVEQASESVMITDVKGAITYVNRAFERSSGYLRDEVIGENPRLLNSGFQPSSFYEAMWATLTADRPWAADFVNRRKDGSLFTEESVISPIHSASGLLTSYAAVKRDVTAERALEARTARLARERALIADMLRDLRPSDTPEETAQAICRQILGLSGIAAAQLFIFELDGRAMTTGFSIAGRPDPPLHRLPSIPSTDLRSRAAQGPWIQSWSAFPEDSYYEELKELGAHRVASAPMRSDGDLIGVLVIDAAESVDDAVFAESLPALVEFANLAAVLIGRDVADRTQAGRARVLIRDIIDAHAFRTVFQPIVDLATSTVVGYEALTRFTDGVGADLRFAEANVVGLGPELEVATLRASFKEAKSLPRAAWLSINASPALILAGKDLGSIRRTTKRRVVLEVTEHVAIADYEGFRDAILSLGPKTELAVDDAGAGFASLRHILELRPAFVKLDRSLIAGVESDDARQAMIVGLRHFARSVGCQLIAEGIETEPERTVLTSLEVQLGQGYLLGRPAPIDEV